MAFAMDDIANLLSWKSAIIGGAFVVLLGLERLFPVARWVGGVARLARNAGLAVVNFVASPLIVIPLTAYAASHALPWRPEWWQGGGGVLLDILLLDAWIYAWHRINHVIPLLWRFHEVHHLDETLDTTSALRFHFGEVLLSALVRAAVIFVLAVPLVSVVVFEVLVLLAALFHHSNLRLPGWLERPLSFIIVTPSIHWVHHHALRSDTDSNYATLLSVWDRVFVSRSPTVRQPDMKIGVERRAERGFLALLIKPFRT
jgi:sterol desaturase/sphingolipid hydroxylase (fatty acid hydroxylase superfamily)